MHIAALHQPSQVQLNQQGNLKHFLCRHVFIFVCVMFLCAICIFCVVPYYEGLV